MKKRHKKAIAAVSTTVIGGLIVLFFANALANYDGTLAKKTWVVTEFLTRQEITANYLNKVEYAVISGKLEALDGKLNLLLSYNGLVYGEPEDCPNPPCVCPRPPCPKKKKKESELVHNDTDAWGF